MAKSSSRLARDVIWSSRFDDELKDLKLKILRLELAVDGLEWVLARAAEQGTPVPQTSLFTWPVHTFESEALIYYRFDEHQVVLLSIRETRADEQEPIS